MLQRRFLDDRMSIQFDLVRGGAALIVLVGHAGQIGLFGRAWPFDDMLQHSAVVVFFVLSGLMIQQSASRPDMTLARFLRARIARILPVAVFSIVFSVGVFVVMARAGLLTADDGSRTDLSVGTLMMPLLFLSERLDGIGFPLNPPYWSLCYEVWFYVIFALYCFTAGWTRVVAIVSAMILAEVPILLLLPTWLVGVATGVHGARIGIRRPRTVLALALLGFAICQWSGLPHVVVRLSSDWGVELTRLRFSTFFLTDFAGAACIACAIVALRHWPVDPARLARVARRYAGISFTLYLTHWPLLLLLQSSLGSVPAVVRMACAIIVPVAFAMLLAPILEGLLPRLLRGREASAGGRRYAYAGAAAPDDTSVHARYG